jgi:alkylation response protein AidB-like acyl-CoA dehydrogenase
MDFQFTEEQSAIQETIRDFMAKECPREIARDLDEHRVFPVKWLDKIAALGFCGLNSPEEFGGGGGNFLGSIIVIEEIAALCPTLASAFASVVLCGGWALSTMGSPDQQRKFLPGIVQGKTRFTIATGEPSEPIETLPSEDNFVLNGAFKFVPLADQVDYILTLARVKAETCFFIVNARSEGLSTKEIAKVGLRGAHLCQVSFSRVQVSREDLLGGQSGLNRGAEQLRTMTELQQMETAALCLGIAQGAYNYAARYARERVQFGKPLVGFEVIQHMLVDIAGELRATRWLLYQAGSMADRGVPCALDAAIAYLHAVQNAREAALQCLHILGGYGYMMEYDAQRYVRDSLSLLEGSVSTAALKNSIGAFLGLEEQGTIR